LYLNPFPEEILQGKKRKQRRFKDRHTCVVFVFQPENWNRTGDAVCTTFFVVLSVVVTFGRVRVASGPSFVEKCPYYQIPTMVLPNVSDGWAKANDTTTQHQRRLGKNQRWYYPTPTIVGQEPTMALPSTNDSRAKANESH